MSGSSANDLDANTLLEFLLGDFEATWNAMAAQAGPGHRGNFMFALQSVLLLEVAGRGLDERGWKAFGAALRRREPLYFTKLPRRSPASPRGWKLPGNGSDPERTLIYVLHDLLRNGSAHQYQPMTGVLSDGGQLVFRVTGPAPGGVLSDALRDGRPAQHLSYQVFDHGVVVDIRTDVLFLDLCASIREVGLPTRPFDHISASYPYTVDDLVAALQAGGHQSRPAIMSGVSRLSPTGAAMPFPSF